MSVVYYYRSVLPGAPPRARLAIKIWGMVPPLRAAQTER